MNFHQLMSVQLFTSSVKKLRNNFNTKHELAGRSWLNGFLNRHKELSIRQAEVVSMQHAQGFNRIKVSKFYSILKDCLFGDDESEKISPANIFNIDETGFTICQKPCKVIAYRGKHNVGHVTSAEKVKQLLLCVVLLLQDSTFLHDHLPSSTT